MNSYDPNSSSTNALLDKIVESNSTNDSPSVIPTLADTTVAQYLSELLSKLNFLNLQDFDLSSVLHILKNRNMFSVDGSLLFSLKICIF
jgi:hypothetical protein